MKIMERDYWINEVNRLMRWLHAHPIKGCVLTTQGLFCGGLWEECGWKVGFIAALFLCAAWTLIVYCDLKKQIALILVAALILGVPKPRQTEALPLLIIGVVLIVVIGGVVGCKVIKKCNKIAKGRENRLTNESPFMVAGGVTHAAMMTWTEGYGSCPEERLLPRVPTVFTMCPMVSSTDVVVLTHADMGYEFTETWAEFEQEVAAYDLFLSRPASYSINGHRCEPEQSIISFSTNRTATVGRGGLLYTIERSSDFKHWEPLVQLNVEPWLLPRIEEASDEDQQHYRITAKPVTHL